VSDFWIEQELFSEVVTRMPKTKIIIVALSPKQFIVQARAGGATWRVCTYREKSKDKTWSKLDKVFDWLRSIGIVNVSFEGDITLSDVE
jgi:hypothetical protein